MGLLNAFGNGLKGLFGEGFADRMAVASALADGDYASAARIRALQDESKASKAKAEQQQQTMLHAYAGLKAMGMSDDQAITLASDPSVAANFVADRNKGQQYSASGGSYYDPITGQTRMAPSRHEFQGSVFDVGGGAPGQQATTTLQHQGVQWVTPQPGTTAFGVNSFTGQPMGQDNPSGGPDATPTVEDGYAYTPGPGGRANQANWKPIGGPSPGGSGGFPY